MENQVKCCIRKRMMTWILITVMVLSLSGCVRYQVDGTVNSDGTIDIRLLYAIYTYDYEDDDDEYDEELMSELREKGWAVEDYFETITYDEAYEGYLISKDNIPLEDLQQELYEMDMEFSDFQCSVENGVCTITWTAEEANQDVDEMISGEELEYYDGYLKFSLTLPDASLIDDNATSRKGNTLSWDLYDISEPVYVCFTLGGGVSVRHETWVTVYEDRTANVEITYAMTDASDKSDLKDDIEDLKDQFEDNGYEVEDYEGKKKDQAEFFGFIASKKEISLEDLEEELTELGIGLDDFRCKQDGNTYTIDWDTSSCVEELAEMGVDSHSLEKLEGYTRFILELPTEATDENSENAEDNFLQWNYFETDENIQATFELPGKGFPMWIIFVIIGVVLAGGATAGVLLLVRKKRSDAKTNQPVTDQTNVGGQLYSVPTVGTSGIASPYVSNAQNPFPGYNTYSQPPQPSQEQVSTQEQPMGLPNPGAENRNR